MSTIFIENKSSYVKLCDPKSYVKDLLFYYKKNFEVLFNFAFIDQYSSTNPTERKQRLFQCLRKMS